MQQQVAVVIPLYKNEINQFDDASLKACSQHLYRYPIRLIGSKSINYQPYLNIFSNAKDIEIININKRYFKNVKGYNRLLLSSSFYKIFEQFNFILIYQTDAYVFNDQLEYWCNQDYDYIGAPWFSDVNNRVFMDGVGNGGFSLRKTKTMLKVLNTPYLKRFVYEPKQDAMYIAGRKNLIRFYKKRKWIKFLINKLKLNIYFLSIANIPLLNNNPLTLSRIMVFHEDVFWSKFARLFYSEIQIPCTQTGLKFSFELSPERCYELNNMQLPFGCHGWMKYGNEKFWKRFIHVLS